MIWLKAFLTGIDPRTWLYLAIVAGVVAYTAAVYHAGGVGPRADLAKEQALHQAEVAKLEAQQESERRQSDVYISQADFDHAENVDRVNKEWDDLVAKMCPGGVDARGVCVGPRRDPVREPVRVTAKVCDNEAGNARLSDALQSYRADVGRFLSNERDENRRTLAAERSQVAGLLRSCQLQTDSLVEVQDWAAAEQSIHRGEGSLLPPH